MTSNRSLFLAATLPFAAFFGVAYGYQLLGESRDYENYLLFYDSIMPQDAFSFSRFEYGFKLFALIAKFSLRADFAEFSAAFVAITLAIKIMVFSRHSNPFIIFFFYASNWLPMHEYTQLRAAMAVSILFIAMNALLNNNIMKFVVLSICATMFHTSALLAAGFIFLAYHLRNSSVSTAIFFVILISAVIPYFVANFGIDIIARFNPIITSYMLNVENLSPPNLLSGSNILTCLLLIGMWMSGGLKSPQTRLVFLISLASIGVTLGFQQVPVLSHRLKEILLVFLAFSAFNPRLSYSNLPQNLAALLLCMWTPYSMISQGIIFS